jgi:hypothetical protein
MAGAFRFCTDWEPRNGSVGEQFGEQLFPKIGCATRESAFWGRQAIDSEQQALGLFNLLNRCSKSRADSAVGIIASKLMAPTIEIRGDR